MKRVLSKILLALAVLMAAGCTAVPLKSRIPTTPESAQTLFLQSLEELARSGPSPALEALHRSFPKSDWTRRADELAELYSSHRQSVRRTRDLKNNLLACEAANWRREKQIDQLRSDLQSLKDLMIEMELRSK